MPDKPATTLGVQVLRMSPGDLARATDDLIDFERASMTEWRDEPDRGHVRTVVRAALLRLLSTDGWMPGAVKASQGRIDIRLTVEFDGDVETLMGFVQEIERKELAVKVERARANLVQLVRRLEEDESSA